MIMCNGNTCQYEGEPKDICKELTYLIMGFVDTLQKDYDLSQEESVDVVVRCANVAVMQPEDRKKYLDALEEYKEVLN